MSELAKEINLYRKIKLLFPIRDGEGKEITELNVRRAKVRDIKRMNELQGSDADKEVYMLALLTGLVPEDLEDLDIADYANVQKAFTEMQKGK